MPISDSSTEHGRWKLDDNAGTETLVMVVLEKEPMPETLTYLSSTFSQLNGATPQPLVLDKPNEHVLQKWSRSAADIGGERKLPILNAAPVREPIYARHEHLRHSLTPMFDQTVMFTFVNLGTATKKG